MFELRGLIAGGHLLQPIWWIMVGHPLSSLLLMTRNELTALLQWSRTPSLYTERTQTPQKPSPGCEVQAEGRWFPPSGLLHRLRDRRARRLQGARIPSWAEGKVNKTWQKHRKRIEDIS